MSCLPQMLLRRLLTTLLVAYWGFIFWTTHTPALPPTMPPVNDKVAHVVTYGVLSFLLALTLHVRGRRRMLWFNVPLIAALYGLADEFLQIPVGRHCSLDDYLADLAGVALGTLLSLLAIRLLPARLNPER